MIPPKVQRLLHKLDALAANPGTEAEGQLAKEKAAEIRAKYVVRADETKSRFTRLRDAERVMSFEFPISRDDSVFQQIIDMLDTWENL